MGRTRHILAVAAAMALVAGGTAVRGQVGQRGYGYGPGPASLSGTYELDRARSDNPERVADQATRTMAPDQRDRVYQNLLNRLDAPESLAIDVRGDAVTISSSNAPQARFDADGRDRTETGPNGRPITTRADVRDGRLVVSTSGNRGADFTVRFEPQPGGLRVTRQLDSQYLNASVTSQAFYRRVADEPRWSVYGERRERGVPLTDGTTLSARLDRNIDSRDAHEGDPFTMSVTGPDPYRGATLQGHVVQTQYGSGRANIVFDFDRIRLTDGESGPFEGQIQSVRTPDGGVIRVDRAGSVRDDRRIDSSNAGDAAVGATIGAIIGAIAGGGKGAAVGAVVGGAGTLMVEGRDNLFLPAGSEVQLVAVAPYRR